MIDHPPEQVDRAGLIAEVLQNHPAQDNWIACGCGEWRSWTRQGEPNGCYEEHVAERVCAALDAATPPPAVFYPCCSRCRSDSHCCCGRGRVGSVGERDQ